MLFPVTLLALFAIQSGLVIAAGVVGVRRRWKRRRRQAELTDEMIARIERDGRLDWEDEPLDRRRIEEAERRFWQEATWDEPEPL